MNLLAVATAEPQTDAAGEFGLIVALLVRRQAAQPVEIDHGGAVNAAEPSAYHAFLETGTWPDKTRLVLEGREGRKEGSINKEGLFQSGAPMAVEVHMKDAVLPGGWGFFAYGGGTDPTPALPQDADCYACHKKDGAVDTTFVQFYPTLLPIAQAKHTAR